VRDLYATQVAVLFCNGYLMSEKSSQSLDLLNHVDPTEARKGSFKLVAIHGIPLYLHWSVIAGMLLIASLTLFTPDLSLYYCLAYAALIVIHELGHIAAAMSLRLQVFALHMTFLGGFCLIERPRGVRTTLIIFAAGFVAQILLLAATILCVIVIGPPTTVFAMCVFNTFTVVNLILILLNLIPLGMGKGMASDGDILWKLFQHVTKGRPHPFPDFYTQSTILPSGTKLASLDAMRPAGFVTGIEIMNDNTTPMEFVVAMLVQHLAMDWDTAIALMLKVHGEGGTLIPIEGIEAAQAIAAAITADAHAAGHQLVCHAVDTRDSTPASN
jgi:ATP-dependent Clp protease adapter protein ClpS